MSQPSGPLVSVVTPVYNMGDFLAECIESILGQTYQNFEYIILNNRSTDRTLEVALHYAQKDRRIQVHTNKEFVGVMENHNIALRLVSPKAKYCKVVCADDFIFPECLAKMVALAEANPSVALVGSYSLAGKKVMHDGLELKTSVVNGKEISRATLLGGPYVFGAPTSLLYRADLIRKPKPFYPNSSPHCDTTACYESLEESDFGFVHQVLSYTRIHAESQTSRSIKYGIIKLAVLSDFCRFGPKYLSPGERKQRLAVLVDDYYNSLVPSFFEQLGNQEFWERQRSEMQQMGLRFRKARLLQKVLSNTATYRRARWLLRPRAAVRKILSSKDNAGKIEPRYYESNNPI
jgi:glycosyltransferase involved in cell wall biosynthesis